MLVGITGHRPERLGVDDGRYYEWIKERLVEFKGSGEKVVLITGMAQGVDQIAARAALDAGVGLRLYYPFKKRMTDFEKYAAEKAEVIRFEQDEYSSGVYLTRDRRIVDDCDVLLVVWDGIKSGGTYYTYKYALEKGKKVEVFKIPVVGTDLNRRSI